MPLTHPILAGSTRLNEILDKGAPSVKPAPPRDDVGAVQRIQRALVALGYGLPKSFPEGPDKDPDGIFGQEVLEAVLAFQKLAFPGHPEEWDGRVGKKVLEKMVENLPKRGALPLDDPPSPKRRVIADIIVKYRGVSKDVGNQKITDEQELLPDSMIQRYLRNQPPYRILKRMGFLTASTWPVPWASEIFSETALEIRRIALVPMDIGKIFVYGSSSGGRNALELAKTLSGVFSFEYLGVADPAFFPKDTTDRPTRWSDPPDVVPTFRMYAGLASRVRVRQNYFQTDGNHTRKENTSLDYNFTSDLNDEIHGEITGFDRYPSILWGKDDSDRHGRLIGIAYPRMRDAIATILNRIPPPESGPVLER
jgi:hypothetical protein